MAVFSSTQNTAACCGGSRYRPIPVGRFAFELRIITAKVTLKAMGVQASFFPDPDATASLRG